MERKLILLNASILGGKAMTCQRSRDNWHSYVKNSLSEKEMLEMEAHLAICSECREVISDILAMADFFSQYKLPLEIPAGLKINIMSAIRKDKFVRSSSQNLDLKTWGFSLAAAGFLLFALNFTPVTSNLAHNLATINNDLGQQVVYPFHTLNLTVHSVWENIKSWPGYTAKLENTIKGGL